MKTKEFKKQIEKLGFKFEANHIQNKYGQNVVEFYRELKLISGFVMMKIVIEPTETNNKKLVDLLYEYVNTHIEEREDEKLYRIHRVPEAGNRGYLSVCIDDTSENKRGDIRIGKAINGGDDYWKSEFIKAEALELNTTYKPFLEEVEYE